MRPCALVTTWVLLWSAGAVAEAAGREAFLHAHCPGPAGEFVGTISARVLLNRAFFDPSRSEAESIRAGVEQQLKYLWGYQHNEEGLRRAWQLVFSSEPIELELVSRREVPYGRTLRLPWKHRSKRTSPQLQIEDAYTLAAVSRGVARATDPALLVEYRARVKLAICGRERPLSDTLAAPLPPDPWLAYWYVPRSHHRPLDYFGERAVTNPCADDDFASLPHPFYYWYDWLPGRHGPDADGRAFDCRPLLLEGRDFSWFQMQLGSSGARQSEHDLSRLRARLLEDANKGPIQATFVFGVLDHSIADPELGSWRDLLEGSGDERSFGARIGAARAAFEKEARKERGTGMLLETLGELGRLLEVERHIASLESGYLVVDVRGRLRRSGQRMRLRLVLGLTDVLGPRAPAHWRYLRDGLLGDQIVVYWGHSGVGENFRLAQIEKNLGLDSARFAHELATAPVRLIAYISCFSYMYFGRDLLAAAAERVAGLVFLFTGMGGTTRDDGPSAVVDLVDRVLAPDNPSGRLERLTGVGDDEFWIVKEVAGAAR